jgi:hypothetical protein
VLFLALNMVIGCVGFDSLILQDKHKNLEIFSDKIGNLKKIGKLTIMN